ncbi:MAG: hypothetical protein BGP06_08705 [Rhizobiales bacterium 65-9]|nr:HdeD family acid-resistance protein [Hyphomicrobiales bacterium]OJY38563.1 MAG: hypothetical protein BGP06_08705 [Rhizobiales bacterium 65-9]
MTDATTTHTLATHLVPLRKNWGWLMGAGVILILLGVFGLAASLLFSLVSVFTFGFMMLIGGVVLLVDAFRREGWKSRMLMLAIGALYVLSGVLVFAMPLSALAGLTLFVGAALVATGVLRIVMAFQLRPMQTWIWVLVSGVLSLLLGALILVQWPASSAWVLGTFLAIELIFQGWAYVMLAQAIRSTFDGVQPKS